MPDVQGDLRRAAAGARGRRRVGGLSAVASPLRPPYRWATVGVLTLVTLIAFEALSISTAMPVVAEDLGAVREYGFVFTSFLTPFLLGVVVAGGWADARGVRDPVIVGLVLFAAGLTACGLAGSIAVLLSGRAVAGAGAGLLVVCMYVVIAQSFPQSMQPRVFSLVSAGWVLPGIIGPAVAGVLAEHVSWRAVFLLVPPLTLLPALALVPQLRRTARRPEPAGAVEAAAPDVRSPMLRSSIGRRVLTGSVLALGAGLVQWGLGQSARSVPVAAGFAAVGVVLILGSFPRLAPPGTLRLGRGLPTVIALRGLFGAAFFAVDSFVPLMLVTERGLSPSLAGLAVSSAAVGWTIGSWWQSRPGLQLPRHLLLVAGGLTIATGITAMSLTIGAVLPFVLPVWLAAAFWGVAAFGMGLGMASLGVLTLRLSPADEQGRNSAALQLSDALCTALGIGLAGAAFSVWHVAPGQDAVLFTGIWLGAAAVALFAGLVAVRARPIGSPIGKPVAVGTA